MQPHSVKALHWLPISVVVLLPVTLFTTFAIAVALGHVEADFPYISDTGTVPPESCIFGQLLNITAVLIGLTCYVRYKQVKEYFGTSSWKTRMNKVALVFGLISAFGVSLVGNFQETSVIAVHIIGALCAFGMGTGYAWLHTVLSFYMYPQLIPRCMCFLRLVLSALSSLAFFLTFIFQTLASKQFHGKSERKWFPEDGGFELHVASTAAEWVLAGSFILYFLSLVPEYRDITMVTPSINLSINSETESGIFPNNEEEDDDPMIV